VATLADIISKRITKSPGDLAGVPPVVIHEAVTRALEGLRRIQAQTDLSSEEVMDRLVEDEWRVCEATGIPGHMDEPGWVSGDDGEWYSPEAAASMAAEATEGED
jgi:hypothetical protein